MKYRIYILISVLLSLAMLALALNYRLTHKSKAPETVEPDTSVSEEDEFHTHARMLVFINGSELNLDNLHYMERDAKAHFHDNDGTIIHIHSEGVTLPYVFKTIGMQLDSKCFIDDKGVSNCTNATSTLRIFINKVEHNADIATYKLENYDKILVNYGNDTPMDLKLKMNNLLPLGGEY